MDQRDWEAMCARLERLERQNARLRMAAVYVAIGFVALLVIGAKFVRQRGVVEAERFVLKDRSGHVRGTFALQIDGTPSLEMNDARGRKAVSVRGLPDGSADLALFSNGQSRIAMYTSSTGAATLNILDPEHGAASGLYLKEDGTLALDFKGGVHSLGLSVAPEGGAKIAFTDVAGKSLGGMSIRPDGTSEIGPAELPNAIAERANPSERHRHSHDDAMRPAVLIPEKRGPVEPIRLHSLTPAGVSESRIARRRTEPVRYSRSSMLVP